jgi:hypothetical protein
MRKTVCVYVGGCIGSPAIKFAEEFDELHIFEPNPVVYFQLIENLKEYKEKLFLQNSACDLQEGFRNFYVTTNLVSSLTCPDIFEPASFRDNGSSYLRSSDEASEIYGRADRSNIARGG